MAMLKVALGDRSRSSARAARAIAAAAALRRAAGCNEASRAGAPVSKLSHRIVHTSRAVTADPPMSAATITHAAGPAVPTTASTAIRIVSVAS